MIQESYKCAVCGCSRYSYAFSALRQVYKPADLRDNKAFIYICCDSCGFISQQNTLLDEELTQCYEEESYVVENSRFMEYLMFLYYHIARRLNKSRGKRIWDIGAGDGAYLAYAKRRGWQVCGSDISRYARKLALVKRQIEVISMEETGELPDKYFDRISLYNVLEHIKDPAGLLSLIKRKLKDNGTCVIMIPVVDSWEQAVFKGRSAWVSAPYHLSMYSEHTMRKLAENNGFEIEKIYNDWYTPSMFSFSIFEILQRRLGIFMPLEAKKIISILMLPLIFPVILLAALFGKSALKSFYFTYEQKTAHRENQA